eukprot:CAMPEP_0203965234 /NCGR_PEP_ID=MMETSP0359-20131031/94787_1 /ASSEMBLY_ACC=CAM_ASM_000338 /TAXON_ID=268821 /ORGANISM="Scrippsiella Hangoei, Strain SHTV-5" /LENGTH=42 /DNA_ID= /DNA_START= /DNA_END= /DNA_ORIENTATION=
MALPLTENYPGAPSALGHADLHKASAQPLGTRDAGRRSRKPP